MFTSFKRPSSPLFDILDLLPDLLQLRLHSDDGIGDLTVGAFRSGGIDHPVHLLDKEIHLPAYGRSSIQHKPELGDVAAQAGDFLAHVALVRQDGAFLREANGVEVNAREQLYVPPLLRTFTDLYHDVNEEISNIGADIRADFLERQRRISIINKELLRKLRKK